MKRDPIVPSIFPTAASLLAQILGSSEPPQLFSTRRQVGPGRKSIMTSRCYQDRSRYTPQSARMAAYQPPVDDAGYVIGSGTTHRERKRRQWLKRMAAAKPA